MLRSATGRSTPKPIDKELPFALANQQAMQYALYCEKSENTTQKFVFVRRQLLTQRTQLQQRNVINHYFNECTFETTQITIDIAYAGAKVATYQYSLVYRENNHTESNPIYYRNINHPPAKWHCFSLGPTDQRLNGGW